MFAIQSEAQTTTGHPEVGQFTGILQQCPGFFGFFFFFFCCHVHSWNKEVKKKKKQKSLFLSNRSRLQDPLPTLMFPALVAKSVGTAFRASSGGGRPTLTYRPALQRTSSCLMWPHAKHTARLKQVLIKINPYTYLSPPPVVKL